MSSWSPAATKSLPAILIGEEGEGSKSNKGGITHKVADVAVPHPRDQIQVLAVFDANEVCDLWRCKDTDADADIDARRNRFVQSGDLVDIHCANTIREWH